MTMKEVEQIRERGLGSQIAGFRGKLNIVEEGEKGVKAGTQVADLGLPSTWPRRRQELMQNTERVVTVSQAGQ